MPVQQGREIKGSSTDIKPTTDILLDSEFYEIDTEDRYRFNQYSRWELIPEIGIKSKRLHSLFIPFENSGTLIFGEPSWRGMIAEMHVSGCMVYSASTSLSVSEHLTDSHGSATVNDLAITALLPKVQVPFSFSDLGANSAAVIGFRDDGVTLLTTTAAFIPTDTAFIGIGYRKTDSNIFVFHNDSSGAVNAIDLGIARSTNIYTVEIEYETTTSCRLTLFDINMAVLYENVFTSEIPSGSTEMGFQAKIQNANTSATYYIHFFDFIRLEKNKAPLNATMDF